MTGQVGSGGGSTGLLVSGGLDVETQEPGVCWAAVA